MLILGSIVLGAADVPRATRFWCDALGLEPTEPLSGNEFTGLRDADGRTVLSIQHSDTEPEPEPRLHLDLFARDSADQAAEVERLVGIGAHRVDWPRYPADADFVVLADTEGNLFCVVDDARASEPFRLFRERDAEKG
ncbi:VOC family protein [Rhodococcus rhodnii]|uniref:VOC domain-containing protein n=2 Tax=Rhodococcus rhodnii TaxID=38312 RepID=R7WVU0_9NOCA|nr:VOC family protein [Rhodococcus rhodnii]EOM78274.1 hypothetical protein Rrhod_0359 [Rhodococcus rhodnii LMG 5362]TXG89284.1 VOC family protein [Rhodococcus rhodnii]